MAATIQNSTLNKCLSMDHSFAIGGNSVSWGSSPATSMLAKLSQVMAAAKARGFSPAVIVAYLIAHKDQISAAIQFLLDLFASGGDTAQVFGASASADDLGADLKACGCDHADVEELLAACPE